MYVCIYLGLTLRRTELDAPPPMIYRGQTEHNQSTCAKKQVSYIFLISVIFLYFADVSIRVDTTQFFLCVDFPVHPSPEVKRLRSRDVYIFYMYRYRCIHIDIYACMYIYLEL